MENKQLFNTQNSFCRPFKSVPFSFKYQILFIFIFVAANLSKIVAQENCLLTKRGPKKSY